MSATRLHRPLLILTALMGATAIASAMLAIIAPIDILGVNGWIKPLKFAVSIAIFAATIALILDTLPARRWLWWLGTAIAALLLVEQVAIMGAVVRGTTSHFNVADALSSTLYTVMGASIAAVWMLTAVLGVLVWRMRGGDPARKVALRLGIVVGLAGMAVAFLMTTPAGSQLDDFQGIAGAHAVGVADGGPGIPLLGWSTEGGDLRVPHFIGMHALQALPLLVWAMERLARSVPTLRRPRVRAGLTWIAGIAWAGITGITTWQALIGEPLVAPSAPVVLAMSLLLAGALLAATGVLRDARAQPAERLTPKVANG